MRRSTAQLHNESKTVLHSPQMGKKLDSQPTPEKEHTQTPIGKGKSYPEEIVPLRPLFKLATEEHNPDLSMR